MLVKEVMNKDVETIRPNETIQRAAELMNKSRIGSLVVLIGGGVVKGIITERDIMNKVVAQNKKPSDVAVEEVMNTDLITISPEISLEDAADIMTENKIKKLPVIEEGKLVGIVTASDLIAYESELIEKVAALLTVSKVSGIGG